MTTENANDETTPDELMESFRGRSLKSIIVFTIFIHAVLLLGTSVPFLMRSVMGEDTSEMSEQERIDKAVREATASLRDIADEHGLNPEDISGRFAGGATRRPAAAPTPPAAGTGGEPATPVAEAKPDEPKSAIEKELDVKAEGPALPAVEDEEEDLFK